MKSIFKFLGLGLTIILISGCDNKEVQVTKCTSVNNNIDAKYNLKSEYTIYSEDNIVNKVEIKETVISSSTPILDYFETYLKNLYETNNNLYGGYNNKIIKENDELISNTTINYKNINFEKYIKDNEIIKDYINNKNELTLDGIKTIYTTLGATCE